MNRPKWFGLNSFTITQGLVATIRASCATSISTRADVCPTMYVTWPVCKRFSISWFIPKSVTCHRRSCRRFGSPIPRDDRSAKSQKHRCCKLDDLGSHLATHDQQAAGDFWLLDHPNSRSLAATQEFLNKTTQKPLKPTETRELDVAITRAVG